MKQRWMKMRRAFVTLALAGACMLSAGSVTAYANIDEAAEAEAQAAEETMETEALAEQAAAEAQEEEPAIDRSGTADGETSFSVPGNGEVLDDIAGDSTKEFYTIRTANNNTFYMVIDKSSTSENVYMLSMVDEEDLSEFLSGSGTEAQLTTTPAVAIEENTTAAGEEETGKDDTAKNMGGYLVIGLIAIIGIAAYYFLKIRPKKEGDETPGENLEMDSGLEIINEDDLEDA